jgi:hypothetical protein
LRGIRNTQQANGGDGVRTIDALNSGGATDKREQCAALTQRISNTGSSNTRALSDDIQIVLPVSDEDWESLQQRSRSKEITLKMAACGCSVFPRRSSWREQHFVHFHPCGITANETDQHKKLVKEIYDACKECGVHAKADLTCSTDPEVVPEPDPQDPILNPRWKADVFVPEKGICFEVQWSSQSYNQTIARQKRYSRDGVKGIWLFRKLPNRQRPVSERYIRLASEKATPMFELRCLQEIAPDSGLITSDFKIDVNFSPWMKDRVPQLLSISDFARALLQERFQVRRSRLVEVSGTLSVWQVPCPFCRHYIRFLRLGGFVATTLCGAVLKLPYSQSPYLYPISYRPLFQAIISSGEYDLDVRQFNDKCYGFRCLHCASMGIERGIVTEMLRSNTKKLRKVKEFVVYAEVEEGLINADHWCTKSECAPSSVSSPDDLDIQPILSRLDQLQWKSNIMSYRKGTS